MMLLLLAFGIYLGCCVIHYSLYLLFDPLDHFDLYIGMLCWIPSVYIVLLG